MAPAPVNSPPPLPTTVVFSGTGMIYLRRLQRREGEKRSDQYVALGICLHRQLHFHRRAHNTTPLLPSPLSALFASSVVTSLSSLPPPVSHNRFPRAASFNTDSSGDRIASEQRMMQKKAAHACDYMQTVDKTLPKNHQAENRRRDTRAGVWQQ